MDAYRQYPIRLRINGADRAFDVESTVTLLDLLRERAGLTGTKKGCDHGQCGACTVLLDGRRINACLTLAVMQDGHDVTTIEGLADGDTLHPLQQAFIDHDAFQCGYCTPGFVMMTKALLAQHPDPADEEIKDYLAGNLCRCGAYVLIAQAVAQVALCPGAHEGERAHRTIVVGTVPG
jgi:xanthine dehydrogenase YagT iron-sulfur-binding subunit